MAFAWHYTVEDWAKKIVVDGHIKLASDVSPPEKPVLWFSTHSICEPTAYKVHTHNGERVRLFTLEEMRSRGLVRFGVDLENLIPWSRLVLHAKISNDTQQMLIKHAVERGASPDDWYGRLTKLPLAHVAIMEAWIDGGWVPDPRLQPNCR